MILVTGSIVAREDSLDALLELCLEHVRRSREEPGCLSHDVHRDAQQPLRLVFVETWEHGEALAAHFRVPASRKFAAALPALTDGPPSLSVYEATPIEPPAM